MNTNITTRLRQVSDKARKLYEVLPETSWMTERNLAKAIKIDAGKIKGLKDELEENGLIEIYFESNGKRSNPVHQIVKSQSPINKHNHYGFSGFYGFDVWNILDRDSLVECYLKSKWNVVPFKQGAKRPLDGLNLESFHRKKVADKLDFFFNNPSLNIGLILPNLTVVDVETKDNVWNSHENFQNTLTVSTPRGFHFYFLNDSVIHTSVKILPDIDVRGKDNFVVLPGSINANGVPYQWENLKKPQHLPVEFRREFRKSYFESYSRAGKFIMPSTIPLGMRNDTLWRYGRSLHWHGKNYFEIETALREANQRCQPPFAPHELEKVISHVYEHPDRV